MGKIKGQPHHRLSLDILPVNVQREIILKKEQGWSYRELVEWLEEVEGFKFSVTAVRKWYLRRKETIAGMVYGSPEFKNRVAQTYAGILLNAKKVTDILLKTITNIYERDKARLKQVKDLNHTALTFLEYFKEIKQMLKDSSGVEELDVDIGKAIQNLRADGYIKSVREVKDEDEEEG